MQYKYKKLVTPGAFGTTVGHKSSEEKEVITLGDIGEYTYVYSEDLSEQPSELQFEQIILTKEELVKLKEGIYIKALEINVQLQIDNLVKDYPQFEIATFPTQESEATAYSKDKTVLTPFIDNLCSSRGIEKEAMINKILVNAATLKELTAPIIGEYQKIIKTA